MALLFFRRFADAEVVPVAAKLPIATCPVPCPVGSKCIKGACVCFPGQIYDPIDNVCTCGAAGLVCPVGSACKFGTCVCPPKTTFDPITTECVPLAGVAPGPFCGAGGIICPPGALCNKKTGTCRCPVGQLFDAVNEVCVCGANLLTALPCPDGTVCSKFGTCVCPAGFVNVGGQCVAGVACKMARGVCRCPLWFVPDLANGVCLRV
jgi:hypothetical protein